MIRISNIRMELQRYMGMRTILRHKFYVERDNLFYSTLKKNKHKKIQN